MIINLTPIRADWMQPTVSVAGDVLTVAGDVLDFSQLAEGGSLPPDAVDCPWVVEAYITRKGGAVVVTLLLPIGPNAPEESRFPSPINMTFDGPVELPPYSAEDAA